MNRRKFLERCAGSLCAVGLGNVAPGQNAASDPAAALQCPLDWLNTVFERAVTDNVLAALNPDVFFGYFSVCADGQGFGFGNSYPSLDGHQLSHALLYLGRNSEVLANWDFVKGYQKPNGHLPIMIDAKGNGLYKHWCPGDPLRALGPVTYAHNAHAIYAHMMNKEWLRANLPSINLAMEYLASLITPEGRVGGAGFYVEMPTRIEWDGVAQCYAVDALDRVAALNKQMNDPSQEARWRGLAERIRANFEREFWRDGQCIEYVHPEHGPICKHGLTDVDWAALAVSMLPDAYAAPLWQRLKDAAGFRYGGMPTGISTAPESYEDWEFIPADEFPNHDRRHDLAAMGRVWYLESWARSRYGDVAGLIDSIKLVAEIGARNDYSWQERYFPSAGEPRPGGPMTYCEYPANLIRIVSQFLLGVLPDVEGNVRIAPRVPADWWKERWSASVHVGAGLLTLCGGEGRFTGTWKDTRERRLLLSPPAGTSWRGSALEQGKEMHIENGLAVCVAPAGVSVTFDLQFA